jgi:aminocarboxymuconate-semialdehyde decarboxylase
MVVDMHNHGVPPEALERLRREPERYGAQVEDGPGGPLIRFRDGGVLRPFPALLELDQRTERLRQQGIDGAVLSVWIDFHRYRLGVEEGVALARLLNDTLAAWIQDRPMYRGFATLPMQDPAAAAAELRRAVDDLGFVGAMIVTHVGHANLDDERLAPVWEAAQALRVPVFLHPADVLGGERLGRHFLHNLLGNPFETALAAVSLILGGVLDRHPDLEIVLAHGGGYLLPAIGRIEHGVRHQPEVASRAADLPSAYLRRFLYDTILFRDEAVRELAHTVGEDRLLLGTDYPFAMQAPDALVQLNRLGLTAVGGRTAARFGFVHGRA